MTARITSFSPPQVSALEEVVIQGVDLQGATQVKFTGAAAVPVTSVSADGRTLRVFAARNAITGPMWVTTPQGTAVSQHITIAAPPQPPPPTPPPPPLSPVAAGAAAATATQNGAQAGRDAALQAYEAAGGHANRPAALAAANAAAHAAGTQAGQDAGNVAAGVKAAMAEVADATALPPTPPPSPGALGASAAAATTAGAAAGKQAASAAYQAAGGRRNHPAAMAAAGAAASAAGSQAGGALGNAGAGHAAAMGQVGRATSRAPEWWLNFRETPYGAMAGQALDRYAGPAAVYTGVRAFQGAMRSGGNAGQTLAQGAQALPRAAFDLGARVGNMLLDGVMQPFGQSGAAVSRLGSAVTGTLERLMNGAGGALGSLAKTGGAVAGGLLAGGLVIGGGALGALFGPPGMLIGAAMGAGIAKGIMGAVEGLAGMVSGALGAVATVFGELGKVAVQAIQSLVDVVKDTVNDALTQSHAMLALSQQTGRGVGASATEVYNAQAFGISAGALSQQNAFVSSIGAGMYGGDNSGSRADLDAYRRTYQNMASQGPIGLMMAQSVEATSGKRGYREMANLPEEAFNRQMDRSETMRGALAMNPRDILEAQQNFSLLVSSVKEASSLIKDKFAVELMPYLSAAFDRGLSYITQNADAIANGIKRSVHWLVADFPPMMLHGAALVARGFGTALDAMGKAASVVPRLFASVAHNVDGLMNSLNRGGATASAAVARGIKAAGDTIEKVFNTLQAVYDKIANSRFGKALEWAFNLSNKAGNAIQNALQSLGVPSGAAAAGSYLAVPLLIKGAKAVGQWGLRQVFGGGAGAGGGAAGGAGAGATAAEEGVFFRAGRFVGQRVIAPAAQYVAGMGATTVAGITAAGTAVGSLGYETLRVGSRWTGIGSFKDMPSQVQMAKYAWYRHQGHSQARAYLEAQGVPDRDINRLFAANRQRILAAQHGHGGAQGGAHGARQGAAQGGVGASAAGSNQHLTWGKNARNVFGTMGTSLENSLAHARGGWDNFWRDPDENTGLSQYIPSVSRGANTLEKWAGSASQTANSAADKLDKLADNWGATLKDIAASSNRTANASEKTKESNDRIAQELGYALIGRISSYIAEDAALNILR